MTKEQSKEILKDAVLELMEKNKIPASKFEIVYDFYYENYVIADIKYYKNNLAVQL
jgi:hypothetical protein